jgi:FKBP-type peptidyl-prolyl cis-trans isomerase SlyD
MTQLSISKGKVVYVTYSIKNQQDEFFEASDMPVPYIQGSDNGLIPKLEQELEGQTTGASVTMSLAPEEAFGPHLPELTFTDDIANVPPEFRKIGAEAQFQNDQGETKTFVVSKIEGNRLTLDGNHPLAGQTVTFHVKVVDVRQATDEELRSGRPADGLQFLQQGHGQAH